MIITKKIRGFENYLVCSTGKIIKTEQLVKHSKLGAQRRQPFIVQVSIHKQTQKEGYWLQKNNSKKFTWKTKEQLEREHLYNCKEFEYLLDDEKERFLK